MPRRTLAAALIVVATGTTFGLLANALSPRGLSLTRNYFPDTPPPALAAAPAPSAAAGPDGSAAQTTRGLPLIDHARTTALFRDARHAQGLVMFVDARNEEVYAQSHIPGAYLVDHYHIERHLAEVLAPAALAEEIVVYCNGGDCADSELTALDLVQVGVPVAKIRIYGGGIAEWKTRREPVEAGARASGESPAR